MNFIVLIVTAFAWIAFDSIAVLIDYRFFSFYTIFKIDCGSAFVGSCIIVAASNIAVIGMGIIGMRKAKNQPPTKA